MSDRRKLRFGVRTPEGRESRVWSVTAVAHGGDVYLAPRDIPAALHFSLHSDRYWHMKLVQPGGALRDSVLMSGAEEIPIDVVPKPFRVGLTRAFTIAISPEGLSRSEEAPDGHVTWLPPAAEPGNWTHFNVFLVAAGVAESWRIAGAKVVGRIRRGDGGAVFVTHHEEPLDTALLAVPPELRDEHGEDIDAGRMAAMLVLPNADESWRIVEGPIEPRGRHGFDVACDRPWRPSREPPRPSESVA